MLALESVDDVSDTSVTYIASLMNLSLDTIEYEYLTAFRDKKRATLSLLLQAPQDPTEDASMTESFLLVLYFNTLHVCFHVEGLEGHQRHH